MSTADGSVGATTKIVDHGPDASRYNIVILGDGYRAAEMAKYHADVQAFVTAFGQTAPFDALWCGINMYRIDVTSTDSGADDPLTCGDGSAGSGAIARTYFDSTFCSGNAIRRLLTCDSASALSVAQARVPAAHVVMVIVNSLLYGGSGGDVATFSTAAGAYEIALHEMGHSAFGFADEYEYYAGCASGETGHDHYAGAEPIEPNVTRNTNRATIKWKSVLTSATDPLPTTANANCAQCDPQPNPQASDYVGAYEGARYMHCGCYRPSYDCRMRELGQPFCAACQKAIRDALAPYLPVAYQGLWWKAPAASESGWGMNIAHQADVIFATWFTYDATGKAWWLSMTAPMVSGGNAYAGALFATKGPPFNAVPFNPALVVPTAVGNGKLTFTDADNGTFAYTVNGVSQTKPITREVFGPMPTCRFGVQPDLSKATNYQDLWWNDPPGSESGWGLNITHQGNTLFLTWFTYDLDGSPLWLSATAQKVGAGATYSGTLCRTTGPPFNATPWNPASVALIQVGTATLAFADGNHAAFSYTVNGVSQAKQITREVFRAPGTVCQ
ncbi:MAG TPA: M64 family metallopeptidase [Casimicrobiaceae bacterium]|nr:M64 family metallopeptidase [Casimicrobiaceae bacterium]